MEILPSEVAKLSVKVKGIQFFISNVVFQFFSFSALFSVFSVFYFECRSYEEQNLFEGCFFSRYSYLISTLSLFLNERIFLRSITG